MKTYHDIAGDGGSRILEQIGEQKELVEKNLSGVRHMVAIGSGKGGVGKSTLTMQIASALRGQGRAVAILDADFNGPSQARLAGLPAQPLIPTDTGIAMPRTRRGIGVVTMGTLVAEPEPVAFDIDRPGDSPVWRASKEFTVLTQFLATMQWGELDILLIDLPPGAERTFQFAEFFGPRAAFVLVTIPSDLARGVVARSIAALRRTPNPILGYIENMKGYYCAGCGAVQPLYPSKGRADFGIAELGAVAFDPQLAELCDRGESIADHPELACARVVSEISERIFNALEDGR